MIYIYVSESCGNLVKPILDALKLQFRKKGENIDFEYQSEDPRAASIYLGPPNREVLENLREMKLFIIVEESLPYELFEYYLTNEIVGVFRKERLEIEYEEKGKLESALKEVLRELMISQVQDLNGSLAISFPYKKIMNWKLSVPEPKKLHDFYKDRKYVSIFLDPSMRSFVRDLRKVMKEFKDFYEKSGFKDRRKKLSAKKFDEMNRNLKSLTSDLNLRKIPSLLIEGETGTGKSMIAEILARGILEEDMKDSYFRFSLVNVEKDLVNSELFGYEKGAYTGADQTKMGILLEYAFGVVFLDEIAEIPPEVQAKLLVYLDDYQLKPLGYSHSIPAPVILVAATNKDLSKAMKEESFRKDLYYRFKYKLRVPSLRERKQDINFLVNFVLLNPEVNPYEEGKGYAIKKISLDALQKLASYDYPGNFRELEDILRQAVNLAVLEGFDTILEKHLKIV
ncbi:sigma 54-interacting transcriptional regulator [Pseudothermotoga sp.]